MFYFPDAFHQPYVLGFSCHPTPGSRMCSFLPVLRKGELKNCTRPIVCRSPQPAAVVLHDGTADGESHAHAGALGGVKRLEDFADGIRIETRPRISHSYHDLIRIKVRRCNEEFACMLVNAAQRFDGVHNQIEHHLL